MIRDIVRMGEPVLLRVADPVEHFGTGELRDLAADMFQTMDAAEGVGLAAPQIALARRAIVFGFEANARYPDAPPVPRTALFNPVLEPLCDEVEDGWEGCLSIPGLRARVPRWRRVRYAGYDVEGRRIEREAEGFHARVVQHEVDHLDGILYPSRIRDFRTFGFTDVLFPEVGEGR
ncbi:peptide deformylase [Pseudoxanthomonas broegbernensis]|uniref:Peptide deformylase n=1 Tax=Pseudoxanthomonas broegbernensis TaxID=83619 RepID=A0A7V8GLU4_9GAMM|nr:peptide deformylase [Pseudoxanthomonas broegbernensis]KAF1686056.1 peptide deformylase [Pseudoxanthomonas broegbernensis]MBB6063686.1 peptide deformylase [Pseudoxanthomonas broegbernensis]